MTSSVRSACEREDEAFLVVADVRRDAKAFDKRKRREDGSGTGWTEVVVWICWCCSKTARPIFGSDVASSRKERVGEVMGQRTYHVLLEVYLVPSFPSLLPTQQVPSIPPQHLVRLELESKHLLRRQGRRGKVGRGEGLGGWEERAGEEVVDSLDSVRLRCPRKGPGFEKREGSEGFRCNC